MYLGFLPHTNTPTQTDAESRLVKAGLKVDLQVTTVDWLAVQLTNEKQTRYMYMY